MKRHVLLLDLKDHPDLIARYEAHHAPGAVPPEVLRSISASGIAAMEIYRSGNRLVMLIETEDGFDPDAKSRSDRLDPDVIAWEQLMDEFQQALSWARPGEKWVATEQIFKLENQRP
jgi:L-rhamnose mutarotase